MLYQYWINHCFGYWKWGAANMNQLLFCCRSYELNVMMIPLCRFNKNSTDCVLVSLLGTLSILKFVQNLYIYLSTSCLEIYCSDIQVILQNFNHYSIKFFGIYCWMHAVNSMGCKNVPVLALVQSVTWTTLNDINIHVLVYWARFHSCQRIRYFSSWIPLYGRFLMA